MSVTLQKGTKLEPGLLPFWNACVDVDVDLESECFREFSIFVHSCHGKDVRAEVRWANQPLFSLQFFPMEDRPEQTFVSLRSPVRQEFLMKFDEWEQFFREQVLDVLDQRIVAYLRLRRKIDSNAQRLLGLLNEVAREPVDQYTDGTFVDL